MNFARGQSGTKVRCESRLFSQGETPEFTKMGEIHELFMLALFWFGLPGRLLIQSVFELATENGLCYEFSYHWGQKDDLPNFYS